MTLLSFRAHYVSPEATAMNLIEAVKNKEFSKAKKICPRYSDGSNISEETYTILFREISKNSDINFFLNKANFKKEKVSGVIPKIIFLPKKRYINITTENSNEKILVSQKNTEIAINDNKIGPLIPYEYTFEFEIEHPTLGSIEKKEKIILDKDKDLKLADETIFLESQLFQKKILSTVSDFFISYNACIENNFDFNLLSNTDNLLKEELSESIKVIKPYLEMYSLSFQTMIMNIDSLKVENNQHTIYFDMFIDRKMAMQIKKEFLKSDNIWQIDSENVTIKLKYNQDIKKWLVADFDFETYEQNPDNWKHKQEIKLKTRNEAIWNITKFDNLI